MLSSRSSRLVAVASASLLLAPLGTAVASATTVDEGDALSIIAEDLSLHAEEESDDPWDRPRDGEDEFTELPGEGEDDFWDVPREGDDASNGEDDPWDSPRVDEDFPNIISLDEPRFVEAIMNPDTGIFELPGEWEGIAAEIQAVNENGTVVGYVITSVFDGAQVPRSGCDDECSPPPPCVDCRIPEDSDDPEISPVLPPQSVPVQPAVNLLGATPTSTATVTAVAVSAPQLASTGADSAVVAGLGVLSVLAGGAAIAAGRARKASR